MCIRDSQNAWNEGLKDTYAADPEDADAARVFGELRKYTDQVQAEICLLYTSRCV